MEIANRNGNTVGIVDGRNIILSAGVGKWEPQQVRELIEDMKKAKSKITGKWAYIANPTGMDPILSKETSAEFVNLHKYCEQNGCVAMGMVVGRKAAIKHAAAQHAQEAHVAMQTLNFATVEDALEWMKTMGL
jgi:hypothetical protein